MSYGDALKAVLDALRAWAKERDLAQRWTTTMRRMGEDDLGAGWEPFAAYEGYICWRKRTD